MSRKKELRVAARQHGVGSLAVGGERPLGSFQGVVPVVALPGRGKIGQQVVKLDQPQAGQGQKLAGTLAQSQIIHGQNYAGSSGSNLVHSSELALMYLALLS